MKTVNKLIVLLLLLFLLSGCTSATSRKLSRDLDAFDKLGVTQILITGKFSSTEYVVTHDGGVRKSSIVHTDPWLTSVKIVREVKE